MTCVQNRISACASCRFNPKNQTHHGETFAGRIVVAISKRRRTFCLDHQRRADDDL